MKRRNFCFYSALFTLSACTATTQSPNPAPSPVVSKLPKLRFAVSDAKGMADLQKDYESLRGVLTKILETPVEFFPVDSYIAVVAALQQDQVDLVFTGPSEYVVMRSRTNVIPIAAIERRDYYPVIVTRAESGIKTVKDLKGKTIALWEVGSTSGYLGPLKLLIEAGLDPKKDVTIEMMGKKGLPALKNGGVDAWGGSFKRYEKFLEEEKLTEQALPMLVKGPTLPSDPFVLNSKLDAALVSDIQRRIFDNQAQILEAIAPADGEKFQGAKMVEVQDQDYNLIREVYQAIGQGAFLQG
ncbi:MAG: phosphate/phosphite/phosphonate ABC transporter substrate-binding protein [Leptolyngbyaceae cyanobacterium bins.59]|nr:phosphate/phosphite/phosphonate ABC transporter substrate-binding protein [Leptolyngbyaceae cyanobacterium bins.59]